MAQIATTSKLFRDIAGLVRDNKPADDDSYVRAMVRNGADREIFTRRALNTVCNCGSPGSEEIVRTFLDNGTDVNALKRETISEACARC